MSSTITLSKVPIGGVFVRKQNWGLEKNQLEVKCIENLSIGTVGNQGLAEIHLIDTPDLTVEYYPGCLAAFLPDEPFLETKTDDPANPIIYSLSRAIAVKYGEKADRDPEDGIGARVFRYGSNGMPYYLLQNDGSPDETPYAINLDKLTHYPSDSEEEVCENMLGEAKRVRVVFVSKSTMIQNGEAHDV